jgi:hypothetical protein
MKQVASHFLGGNCALTCRILMFFLFLFQMLKNMEIKDSEDSDATMQTTRVEEGGEGDSSPYCWPKRYGDLVSL